MTGRPRLLMTITGTFTTSTRTRILFLLAGGPAWSGRVEVCKAGLLPPDTAEPGGGSCARRRWTVTAQSPTRNTRTGNFRKTLFLGPLRRAGLLFACPVLRGHIRSALLCFRIGIRLRIRQSLFYLKRAGKV